MHEQARDLQPAAEVAPAVRLLDRYLYTAVESGASDLHFKPRSRHRRHLVVRMRVDGELSELEPPPPALVEALLLRARLLARVDLAEKRQPQDGRFSFTHPLHGRIDVRAAFVAVVGGERMALRLLAATGTGLGLAQLGLDEEERVLLCSALARPDGLILVAGPTGCGKTTTLYASIEELRRPDRCVVTVEDPVGGCPACNGSGYRGRKGLFEFAVGHPGHVCGFRPATLFEAGLSRAASGETSVAEVLARCPRRTHPMTRPRGVV